MKKGFTLIELLAVIVILAIIALIATPIVLNIISNTKENAQLRSAEMYLDAVEQSVMMKKMKETTFNPNTCEIKDKKLYCNESEKELKVEVDGEKPDSGIIIFTEGKIDQVSLRYSNGKTILMNNKGELEYKNYVSISNYQHQHTNGKVEDHEVTFDSNGHGICSKCGENVLAAGLYAEDGTMTHSWQKLFDGGYLFVNDGELVADTALAGNKTSSAISVLKGKLIIDNGVTSIGNYAFNACSELTFVGIPDSVTNIGVQAFYGCTGLEEIDFGNGVTSIGSSSFQRCTSLTYIKLPDSLKNIQGQVFADCYNLTSIYIPENVISIYAPSWSSSFAPFYNCSSSLKLYCGVSEKQSGWETYWNYYSNTGTLSVEYGVTREEYEAIIAQ